MPDEKNDKAASASEREDRLKAALRANLRRRKAAARKKGADEKLDKPDQTGET